MAVQLKQLASQVISKDKSQKKYGLKSTNKSKTKVKPEARSKAKPEARSKVEFEFAFRSLKKKYPNAHCALNFSNPYELLIATILSAQCTDEKVNQVTPELFKRYPDTKAMSESVLTELEKLIKPTGFFRNKAKNIKTCCELLVQKHGGQVPKTIEELCELPGVGRKTANVVLGNAYQITSGVAVDTHVTRLSNRFGWVKTNDAVKIEAKLNKMCPQKDWIIFSHYLIAHGRSICVARSPKCQDCFIKDACPKLGV